MIRNSASPVEAAFETLLEEVEVQIVFVSEVGSRAFAAREYERAKEALERAAAFTTFREQVTKLRQEWLALEFTPEQDETDRTDRRDLPRLRPGLRTSEESYVGPILSTLVECGGRAKMADLLLEVERKMRSILNEVDYQTLHSLPGTPRWRNTAQWARNTMVKKGLLRADSPWGVWEISEAGRRWLGQTP